MNEFVQNFVDNITVSAQESEGDKIQLNVAEVLAQLGIKRERWNDFIEDSSFFLRGQMR